MRKLYFLLGLLLVIGLSRAGASSLGGAILYNPVWNTHYEFHLFLIKPCNGPAAADSLQLQSNVPGISSIWVYRSDTMHLNDRCLPGTVFNGGMNCQNGEGVTGIRYSSRPVDFTQVGSIPFFGFRFSYSECCRDSMDNINGTPNLYLVAHMLPFIQHGVSFTPLQLADATPLPVNLPEIFTYATQDTVLRSFQAIDFNGDAVQYDFRLPWSADSVAVVPASGFSQMNPFQGAIARQGRLIDLDRGLVSFAATPNGRQSINLILSSYRCGQRISVSQIEFPHFVNPVPASEAQNKAPLIRIHGGDQNGTLYVYPRDTMFAEITALDTAGGNIAPVSIYLPLLQTSLFSLPGVGCSTPPCLFSLGRAYNSSTYMFPQPIYNQNDTLGIGYTANGGVTAMLSAIVDCNQRILGSCLDTIQEFDLLMTARDGRCVVNNRREQPVRIRMMDLPLLSAPALRVEIQTPATLVWDAPIDSNLILPGTNQLTSLRIQRASFVAYEIYRKSLTDTSQSPFALVATITNFNQRSWVDSLGNASYYLKVISGCNEQPSNASPIVNSFATSINTERLSAIRVYPNPSRGQLMVEHNEKLLEISAFDVQGRLLKRFERHSLSEKTELDLRGYSGIVLLQLQLEGQFQMRKILIQPE